MIIQQAFVRETINTWAAVASVVIAIFSVTRLVGFLGAATDHAIALDSIFVLLALKLIFYLDVILVLSAYLSILLVLGRWINDREMTALNTLGFDLTYFLKPAMVVFLIAGTTVAAFSFYLGPLAGQIGHAIEHDFKNRSELLGITVGEFNEIRSGAWVYFISTQNPDSKTFADIFLHRGEASEDEVVSAKTGYVDVDERTGENLLILKNGSQYKINADENSYAVTAFETYSARLKTPPAKSWNVPVKSQSTLALLQGGRRDLQIELYWRASKVMMLGVLILFALSFTSPSYRKGRFLSMLFAFLVYFFYANMLGAAIALSGKGGVAPHLLFGSTHLAFLVAGILLFHLRYQSKPLAPWKKSR